MDRMYRKVKDEYLSEKSDEPIKIGVDLYFDSYLFEQNYEEDYDSGEYDFDEEIDWDLVNDIAGEVEDKFCKVIGDYFGGGYCSYYHGGRTGDDTCYEMSSYESILLDKIGNELPVESVDESDDAIDFYLLNNNSVLSSIWGDEVITSLEAQYSDTKSMKILADVVEVYLMGADLWVNDPTPAIVELAKDLK